MATPSVKPLFQQMLDARSPEDLKTAVAEWSKLRGPSNDAKRQTEKSPDPRAGRRKPAPPNVKPDIAD